MFLCHIAWISQFGLVFYLAIIHCYPICRWMMHPHPHGLLLLAGGMSPPPPPAVVPPPPPPPPPTVLPPPPPAAVGGVCRPLHHPHLLSPDMVGAVAVVVVAVVMATMAMVIGQPHIIIIGYVSVIYFCSTVKLFLNSL